MIGTSSPCAAADASVVPDAAYLVQPRSLVVLWTRLHTEVSGGLRHPV